MKKVIVIFAFIGILNVVTFSQYKKVSEETFKKVVQETTTLLQRGRYMVNPATEKKVSNIEGWEGIELTQYEYKVSNKATGKKENIPATVILYNPSPELLVKWVINSLTKAKVKPSYKNINTVIKYINGQSNAQFPVRGVVYEDIACKDGIQETYTFFDGVTVDVKDATIQTYKKNTCEFTKERLSPEQIKGLLTIKFEQVDKVKDKGRISSTTRGEYKQAFPNADISVSSNWVNIVREEYKKAMTSEENNLIYATVSGNKVLYKEFEK